MSYLAMRNQRALAKCQEAYDNMEPPEYWEDDEEVIDIEADIDVEEDDYDGILGEG